MFLQLEPKGKCDWIGDYGTYNAHQSTCKNEVLGVSQTQTSSIGNAANAVAAAAAATQNQPPPPTIEEKPSAPPPTTTAQKNPQPPPQQADKKEEKASKKKEAAEKKQVEKKAEKKQEKKNPSAKAAVHPSAKAAVSGKNEGTTTMSNGAATAGSSIVGEQDHLHQKPSHTGDHVTTGGPRDGGAAGGGTATTAPPATPSTTAGPPQQAPHITSQQPPPPTPAVIIKGSSSAEQNPRITASTADSVRGSSGSTTGAGGGAGGNNNNLDVPPNLGHGASTGGTVASTSKGSTSTGGTVASTPDSSMPGRISPRPDSAGPRPTAATEQYGGGPPQQGGGTQQQIIMSANNHQWEQPPPNNFNFQEGPPQQDFPRGPQPTQKIPATSGQQHQPLTIPLIPNAADHAPAVVPHGGPPTTNMVPNGVPQHRLPVLSRRFHDPEGQEIGISTAQFDPRGENTIQILPQQHLMIIEEHASGWTYVRNRSDGASAGWIPAWVIAKGPPNVAMERWGRVVCRYIWGEDEVF